MTKQTRIWAQGIIAAFIGAASSSFGTIQVAPDRFNLTSWSGIRNVVLSSLFSGFTAAAMKLSKTPIPALEEVQTQQDTQVGVSGGTLTASTTTTTTKTTQ